MKPGPCAKPVSSPENVDVVKRLLSILLILCRPTTERLAAAEVGIAEA